MCLTEEAIRFVRVAFAGHVSQREQRIARAPCVANLTERRERRAVQRARRVAIAARLRYLCLEIAAPRRPRVVTEPIARGADVTVQRGRARMIAFVECHRREIAEGSCRRVIVADFAPGRQRLVGQPSSGRVLMHRTFADARCVELNATGVCERAMHQYTSARRLFDEALSTWREVGDDHAAARALSNLAAVAFDEGDHARATALYGDVRAACDRLGDHAGAAWASNFEAQVAQARGDRDTARALYGAALASFRQIRDAWGTGDTLLALGHMTCEGDPHESNGFFREAHAVFAASGDTRGLVRVLEAFVCLAVREGDSRKALRLAGASAAIRQSIGIPLPPFERDNLEHALERVRRATDAAAAGRAWAEGWSMSTDDALRLALG